MIFSQVTIRVEIFWQLCYNRATHYLKRGFTMTLVYQSTRDENNKVTASQAILQGLATDGGLFTPLSTPEVALDFDQLKDASYQEVAKLVLSAFLDDFTEEELDYCITNAYDDKFDTAAIAPVVKLKNHYNLELFHGSTIAFKDMALLANNIS